MNRSLPALVLFALAVPGRPARAARPVTLREAVSAALARSPDLAAAEASREEGAAGARLARAAFRPSASLVATPGYASGLPVAVAGQVPAIGGVDLRQTLYDPSARADALEAEAAGAGGAGAAEAARTAVARATVVLYARCRADGDIVAAAQRRADAAKEILDHTEARRREGRETDLSVERASLAFARARQKALDAASDADLDLRELRLSIGADPGEEIALVDDPGTALEGGVPDRSAAIAADPELRALDRQAEILEALRQARSRAVAPVVQAEAQYWRLASMYDRYYNHFKADDWSIGVAVAVPVFSGGRIGEGRVRAEQAARRAEARARERREALELLLERRESEAARAETAAVLARRERGVAEQAVGVAEALGREGRGSPDAPAESRTALADSDEALARAELGRVAARAEWLGTAGVLVPRLVAASGEN